MSLFWGEVKFNRYDLIRCGVGAKWFRVKAGKGGKEEERQISNPNVVALERVLQVCVFLQLTTVGVRLGRAFGEAFARGEI